VCLYYGGGIIIVVIILFKVSGVLLTQDGALLCEVQGGQVVRNASVLMAVMEMTRSLVRNPPGAAVSGSWPAKICLNGNLVKGMVCRHRCVYGVVELDLLKQDINIAWCPTEGEKQQVGDFQLRPCSSAETLLSSAVLNLLEGVTRDWYIPVSWLGNRETGPLCMRWDKEEEKVWREVF